MPCPNDARQRCVTVSFRVSPEQAQHLDVLVAASGMTKQDYIMAKLADETVVVQPSTKVYKALKNVMHDIYLELTRIHTGCALDKRTAAMVALLAREFIGFGGGSTAFNIETEAVKINEMGRD